MKKIKQNFFGRWESDFKNMSCSQLEKVKKELQVLVKEFGLNLIIECNKTTFNYLDITLNLLDGTYKPYQKPENTLQYIYKECSHPPIIKLILITIVDFPFAILFIHKIG